MFYSVMGILQKEALAVVKFDVKLGFVLHRVGPLYLKRLVGLSFRTHIDPPNFSGRGNLCP